MWDSLSFSMAEQQRWLIMGIEMESYQGAIYTSEILVLWYEIKLLGVCLKLSVHRGCTAQRIQHQALCRYCNSILEVLWNFVCFMSIFILHRSQFYIHPHVLMCMCLLWKAVYLSSVRKRNTPQNTRTDSSINRIRPCSKFSQQFWRGIRLGRTASPTLFARKKALNTRWSLHIIFLSFLYL